MTTTQYLLNLGLLAYVLYSNLGTKTLTRTRMVLPLVVVAVAAYVFLREMPAIGNDARLELAGAAAGVALGVAAGLLVRVRRAGERMVTVAGAWYAALWVAVIGGRMLFAYGADHWFSAGIATFSRTHLITGADAWTAAFVLMALAMVVTRVLVTGARALRTSTRPAPVMS
ncbi:hypothetical protein [Microbispora sp. NBC_01389]|uniref:hypothetical protein n=1 Tax=Microbispora sp. NBC_01389 TaxID=2903584 RepID=UPI003243270B